MFVYLVRNKFDGQVIQVCKTKEIADKFASRLSNCYVDEFVLITHLD